MTGKRGRVRKQRVKLPTMGLAGLLAIVQWLASVRLKQIEEVALGSLESGAGAPDMEEAIEAILRIMEGRGGKAEWKTVEDHMRAQAMEWWQDFPKPQLLTDLYRRDALRRKKFGSRDSSRPPSHPEGLCIARPMLADLPDVSRFDSEWEFESVSKVLAVLFFHPIGAPSPKRLQEYIERSQSNRVHYDALKRIEKELDKLSKATPPQLSRWSLGDADGLPQRPPGRNLPPHRPADPATLMRNVQIEVTIRLLERVGIPPYGTDVSGCRIVAEALEPEFSEKHVKHIWEGRIWKEGAFEDVMCKHSKAIAKRTGLARSHGKG